MSSLPPTSKSLKAAKRAGEIAGVDGVDCVMIGPLDMSASMGMGYLRDPGIKKVKEVMKVAEGAVVSGGEAYLAGFSFSMPHDPPNEMKKRGYHMVCGGVDLALFRNAALVDVKKFRMDLV